MLRDVQMLQGGADALLDLAGRGFQGGGGIQILDLVFLLQGSMTLLSRLLEPVMTEGAIANISMIGSILIFCVGINLVWGKTIRVANMLPAVLLAVLAVYLPSM